MAARETQRPILSAVFSGPIREKPYLSTAEFGNSSEPALDDRMQHNENSVDPDLRNGIAPVLGTPPFLKNCIEVIGHTPCRKNASSTVFKMLVHHKSIIERQFCVLGTVRQLLSRETIPQTCSGLEIGD
jgi:hypothetical protein